MSQIQGAGGQPQKQTKYAPIYTGRIFNGLYTNRSPLRGVSAAMLEQFYKVSYGDVMISGSNVEVSNRLTLVRRPGNPNYDANTWNNVLSFDEFRVNKSADDIFGHVLEQIFTMVSEPGKLFSLTSDLVQTKIFDNSANVSGQTFMQEVGNSLYFSNGVDNKKWLQSLFVRDATNNSQFPQGSDGLAGTYPFGTFFIDPNKNIQEMIGISVGNITNVALTSNVLTLTVTMPASSPAYTGLTSTNMVSFMLWGLDTQTWLNGLIISTATNYAGGAGTWVLTAAVTHANVVSAAETGYLQQIGTIPVIAKTGSSLPTWNANVLNTSVNSGATAPQGNITLDGNILWMNRGGQVENWGIQAPTKAITTTESGSSSVGWKPNTFYSAPGVFIDSNGNIWQVTTAGTTGATSAPFLAQATPTLNVTTVTSGTAVFTNVGTVVGTETTWKPHTNYQEGKYSGAYPWPTSTPEDGAFLPDWKSGTFIVAGSPPALFMLQKNIPINNINVPISVTFGGGTVATLGWTCKFWNHSNSSTTIDATHAGAFDLDFSSPGSPVLYGTGTASPPTASATGVSSLLWDYYNIGDIASGPMKNYTMNSAGEVNASTFTTPWPAMPAPSAASGFEFAQFGKIRIPVDGITVTFSILANSTCFFGIEAAAGAALISFSNSSSASQQSGEANLSQLGTRTLTSWNGYPIIAGLNGFSNEYGSAMTVVINFPTAGVYGIEFDYARAYSGESHPRNYFFITANGSQLVPETATTQPWFESTAATPVWGTAAWNLLSAAQNTYPGVVELSGNAASWDAIFPATNGNQLKWFNLGPVPDFAFVANTPVTLPSTIIIDTNSNEQRSYETGVSGATQPTWQTTLFALTADQAPLQWINLGSIPPVTNTPGTITATSTQGFKYWIALVNTLDQTVSNASPVSLGTGPIISGQITIPAGSGLNIAAIDPQVDYVAIFRTTDNGSIPLLVPGLGNSFWTVPLTQYLQNGYIDTTPDIGLDELVQGAINGENTPPPTGTVNLSYHLNRIWYSVGNVVWFTTGPRAPSGNGNGTSPLNFSQLPSQVRRLVPTAIGMLAFTVSDIYIIPGNGTDTNPILPAIPYLTGVGLASYNALDINGGLIGFFTTDMQFVIFNPSAGLDYAGFPIGDQLRLKNGTPGQTWNSNSIYVSWYTNGEDQAWFLGDGINGWYKFIQTPAPETGTSWSPFATINGGQSIKAIKAVEVSPGLHKLLIGPSGTGHILNRDLDSSADAGGSVAPVSHLLSAFPFVVLAASAVTGSAGAGSTITGGNLGIYPNNSSSITNFPPSVVNPPGVIHAADAVAQQAQIDLTAAMVYYSSLPATLSGLSNLSTGGNGSTAFTYTPGVYVGASSLSMPTGITLDAQGNPDAVFVFVAGSTVNLASGQSVTLVNGAQAGNVYWVVGSSFTAVATSTMVGTIMAAVSITLGGGVLNGRALASTGAVTMSTTTTLTLPTTTTGAVGNTYPAFAVFGSYVLALPGQVAKVAFITTLSVKVGSPLIIGLLIDEALPYFKGSFDIIKRWVNDPPNLPESKSFFKQRFYLSENHEETAYCSDLQFMVQWPAEAAQNELQSFTIWGAYEVEQ